MKMIYTGITALYKQNIITYASKKEHIEMLYGTNTTTYQNLYEVSLQSKTTFSIGAIEKNGEYMYSPERLFIEFNKFKMESTIKKEALIGLKKIISPELVKKYYDLLKGKRRMLDEESIEKFLDENLLNIKSLVLSGLDNKILMREYVMALVSRDDIPVSLIKGGSSIELFTKINRATLDIDSHTGKGSIESILESLMNKEQEIYFKLDPLYKSNLENFLKKENIKKVLKISLIPMSRGGILKKELEEISIPISFNVSYNNEELHKIIKDFSITKKRLKTIPNVSAMIFSREMLLAEKFHSIIMKPSTLTRTKDLIDLELIWSNNINEVDFRKWFFRKAKNDRHSLNEEEAIKKINENKNLELTKIKANFSDAISMYDAPITFESCIEKYNKLIEKVLQRKNKRKS